MRDTSAAPDAHRVRPARTGISDTKMVDTAGARINKVDPNPARDLDHTRVTEDIVDAGAIAGVTVLDNERVRAASDHRPKQLRLRRSRLPRTPFERQRVV